MALASLAACRTPAELHADWATFSVARIDVPAPANETIHPLDHMRYGGPLQNLVTGPSEYDLIALLHRELRGALEEKGYDVSTGRSARAESGAGAIDYRRPLPDGSPAPPFDAVLFVTFVRWSGPGATAPPRIATTMRAELIAQPSGERVYALEEDYSLIADRGGDQRGQFVAEGMRRIARRLLLDLPPRR